MAWRIVLYRDDEGEPHLVDFGDDHDWAEQQWGDARLQLADKKPVKIVGPTARVLVKWQDIREIRLEEAPEPLGQGGPLLR